MHPLQFLILIEAAIKISVKGQDDGNIDGDYTAMYTSSDKQSYDYGGLQENFLDNDKEDFTGAQPISGLTQNPAGFESDLNDVARDKSGLNEAQGDHSNYDEDYDTATAISASADASSDAKSEPTNENVDGGDQTYTLDCATMRDVPDILPFYLDQMRRLQNTPFVEDPCIVVITCFKDALLSTTTPEYVNSTNNTDMSNKTFMSTTTPDPFAIFGEFANYTLDDCSQYATPEPDSELNDASRTSADPDVQMRSLWASIFRLKLKFVRPAEPGVPTPLYNEYVSVLFNYNFPIGMRSNYLARTGKPLVRLMRQRIRVTGLSDGRSGDPVLNAPCYRKYIQSQEQTMNFYLQSWLPREIQDFDICVCQKVEFNPTATVLNGDAQAVIENAVTQTRGLQSVDGKWITLDLTHVTPDVCIGSLDADSGITTGCCDPDPRAVPRVDMPSFAGNQYVSKRFAEEILSIFFIENTTQFQPFDEREAFEQSEQWQIAKSERRLREMTSIRDF
ncbi:uncharacterized protein LOC129600833 [Paramacrobiotus metropolitanus]|uniref:uncharacterized protein LOC129600833 n=1 Tax=Paramacrobiotus metropolitanus TaxID=2943436 RepID=UPI0024459B56|nr:uncharacterized protein LOC129600833 [Paramacrobiotus metropolitanus]XP_055355415.1 uncharacterized protein LOC129600833 [Paramacrobiotus metropolitanus]XP_055355416.1 uncharacterized protein LOC129600833 [Paramacrobiotus metropolitanus]XP_055355418.1 uncharacterized protein LOC129600833 [Paramacrobiotus metropolitanus]XP_055355419.1 uncharacterized protein LOC129600833 [Paramacrobiotus metropolitanus]XP_055355420.1 uncharacterized protein LOC129600833 [Paramacrobiotus metropolitanus]